jgi:hypothetical protein
VDRVEFVPSVLLLQGLGGVKQYAGSFLLLSLLVHAPSALQAFATHVYEHRLPGGGTEVSWPDEVTRTSLVYGFAMVYVLLGALAYGCLTPLRGGRPSFGAVVLRGLRGVVFMLPVAAPVFVLVAAPTFLAVLLGAVGLPLVAAIALGFWLHGALVLAVPVAYDERIGVFRALRRSVELSAGCRWRLVLILLASAAMFGVLFMAGMAASQSLLPRLEAPHGFLLSITVAGILVMPVHATTVWIVYETIQRHRGASDPPIARVFE